MATHKATWHDAALTSLDHIHIALDTITQHTELTADPIEQVRLGTIDLGAADSLEIAERATRAHAKLRRLIAKAEVECADALAALELFLPPQERTRTNAGISQLKGHTN